MFWITCLCIILKSENNRGVKQGADFLSRLNVVEQSLNSCNDTFQRLKVISLKCHAATPLLVSQTLRNQPEEQ